MTLQEFNDAYKRAIDDDRQAVSKRQDNMFLGPIGIEERLHILHEQLNMAHWAIYHLMRALLEERSTVGKTGGNNG